MKWFATQLTSIRNDIPLLGLEGDFTCLQAVCLSVELLLIISFALEYELGCWNKEESKGDPGNFPSIWSGLSCITSKPVHRDK